MKFNTDEYKEFIKDESELNFMVTYDEQPDDVELVYKGIKMFLDSSLRNKEINNYTIVENRIEIDAKKYYIHMLILHSGDVCQYTINKKTNYKGNYSRRMFPRAVIDTMMNFI
ncbi:MAG TPA: hypothetical protein VNR61_19120 [Niallia sp.]|nr:hypothetical protein [Niallia sp.]